MNDPSSDFLADFVFEQTKPFAQYLIDSDNHLDYLAKRNVEMLKYYNIPALKYFDHLKDDEFLKIAKDELKKFLETIVDGTAVEVYYEKIQKWQDGRNQSLGFDDVQILDVIIYYSIGRQLFIEMLVKYSDDARLITKIMMEVERFYVVLSYKTFKTFQFLNNQIIHKKNEILSSIVSHSINGIVAFDNDFHFLEWNKVMEERYNISKEETEGKTLYDLFPDIKGSPRYSSYLKVLKGESIVLHNQYDDRTNMWFESYLVPLFDSEHKQFGFVNVLQDITDAKKREKKLKEQKEELASANEELASSNEELMENMAQLEEYQQIIDEKQNLLKEAQTIAKLGTYEYHFDTELVMVSDELKHIFGLTKETISLSVKEFLDLFSSEDSKMLKQQWEYSKKSSFQVKCELQIESAVNKETKWVNFISQSVTSHDKIAKIRGIIQDITEKKLVEIRILKEKHFINSITETSPDIISIFDLKKKINVYSNREIQEMLGYSKDEAKQMIDHNVYGLKQLVHPDDFPVLRKVVSEMEKLNNDEVKSVEYRILNKKGEYRYISARYRTFKRDEQGNVEQLIAVSRDITDLKKAYFELNHTNEELVRAEEQLIEVNNELEKRVESRTNDLMSVNEKLKNANTDLENFIYTASHDLKSPINNLEGLLNMLKKKLISKKQENGNIAILEMMDSSIKRLVRTIGDLAEVTRLNNDLLETGTAYSNVKEIFEEVIEDLKGLKKSKNASIEIDTKVKNINFFPKNFRSLVYNLLSNALKYSHPDRKPKVQLKTSMRDKQMVLEVIDNGLGIPKEQQKRIFSFFNRYHYNYAEGSGIGLYIVKRIVDNSQSKIELDSTPDVGTTFRIVFNEKYTPEN